MSISHYTILRTLISLSYIDGKIARSEKVWLERMIQKHITEDDQIAQLKNDLHNPLLYLDAFKKIDNYFAREQLLSYSRHLFGLDGKLSDDEAYAYKKLSEIHNDLSDDLKSDQRQAAKNIMLNERERKFYLEIAAAGKVLRERKNPFYFNGPYFVLLSTIFYNIKRSGAKYAFLFIAVSLIMIAVFSFTLIYYSR